MEITANRYFRRTMKYVQYLLFTAACSIVFMFLFILSIFTYAKLLGPPPLEVPQSTIYYASDGTVIGETDSGQKRYWALLDDISPHLIHATLSIEDQRFYSHFGFDIKRIIGALVADIKAMSKVQGASTISQQYARNLFLTHEKTWTRS